MGEMGWAQAVLPTHCLTVGEYYHSHLAEGKEGTDVTGLNLPMVLWVSKS